VRPHPRDFSSNPTIQSEQNGKIMAWKKIRKAVIPAAGLGTRFLPATKAIPKELLPIVDKPSIQYIVEEAIGAGIEEIILVTSPGKTAILEHFSPNPELEKKLARSGKGGLLASTRAISSMARIKNVIQDQALGLGHAILCARDAVAGEPFAVLLPDDLVDSAIPCIKQLIDVSLAKKKPVVALLKVRNEETSLYGIIEGRRLGPRLYDIDTMIEKPEPGSAPSNLAVIGRYVLPPEIFDLIEKSEPGKGGEIQLTDSLDELSISSGLLGSLFSGKRYDGDKFGFLQANLAYAMKNHELKKKITNMLLR
jgi:UTP--glucose-1-phosphate uridylyltransferase